MDTEKQPERTIVVRAVYDGIGPALSRPKEPFFIGSMPIIAAITKGVPIERLVNYGHPFENVEFLQGSLEYNREEEKTGVSEKTVLVIYDVPVSEAEIWNDIPGWKFERLSWSKYREIINDRYERINKLRDTLADKLTTGWARFYGLQIDSEIPTVVRFDLWLGKHPKDPQLESTDRYHYHVTLKGYGKLRVADLFNAIEYIEQAFYSLNVDCEVAVKINTEEVYRSPKGLTDETKE